MKKNKILSAFLSLSLSMTSFAAVPVTASAAETTTTAPTVIQTTTVPTNNQTTTKPPETTTPTTTITTKEVQEGAFTAVINVRAADTGETLKNVDVAFVEYDADLMVNPDAKIIRTIAEWNTSDNDSYTIENIPFVQGHFYFVKIDNVPSGYSFNNKSSYLNGVHGDGILSGVQFYNVSVSKTPTLDSVVEYPAEGKFPIKFTVADEASKEVFKDLDIELYSLDAYSSNANFIDKLAEWNTSEYGTYSCELSYRFEDKNSYSAYGVVIKNMPEGYVYSFSGENSKCFPVDYRPITIWTDVIIGNDTHEHEYVILIEKEGTVHNPVTTKPDSPTIVTTETTAVLPTLEEVVEFPTEGKFPMKFKVADEASKEVFKDLDIELYSLDAYSSNANFIDKLAEWNTSEYETYSCELPYSFENQDSYSAYGVVIKNMPEGYVYSFSGENSKCFPVDYRPATLWEDIVNGNETHEHEYVILIEKEGTIHNPVTTSVSDSDVTTTTTTTTAEPVKGDANCDGELSMADAVLIMQSIANPAKFGIEGTDENHITEQGKKNADIAGNNDGITNADALAIQKKLLKLD